MCGNGVFCSLMLSDQPLVCAWDEVSEDTDAQWLVLELVLVAKKTTAASMGFMLKTADDDTQV